MKILISTDTYHPHVNGASYFTQRLAHNLQAHGHEVCVIAPSESFRNSDTIINNVRVFGMYSYPILFYSKFRFCFFFFRNNHIKNIIDDFQPDVIHLQGHFAISKMVIKVAKEKNIPLVATNHFMPDNLVHYLPLYSIIGSTAKKLAWRDFYTTFKNVDKITTPTETAARLIQPYFEKTIVPISCGINLSIFNSKNDGEYLRKHYGIGPLPILLYVGRLDKEKNLDTVLHAVAKALTTINVQLVIAGTGKEKDNLIELSGKLGIRKNVVFTGFIPNEDLPNLYAIASCFIIAGTAELQSIVTMEAMASGLPILGVDALALPELIKNKRNGFLFKHGDTNDLSEKIILIFSDKSLREVMGRESLILISQHDMKKSIKKFEDIYAGEINRNHNT